VFGRNRTINKTYNCNYISRVYISATIKWQPFYNWVIKRAFSKLSLMMMSTSRLRFRIFNASKGSFFPFRIPLFNPIIKTNRFCMLTHHDTLVFVAMGSFKAHYPFIVPLPAVACLVCRMENRLTRCCPCSGYKFHKDRFLLFCSFVFRMKLLRHFRNTGHFGVRMRLKNNRTVTHGDKTKQNGEG